ncbi:MAG: type 4a pilus biogenesis protein PilO [Candidatus Zambryskibacteria bacterium]|nr:type 4a pilus biogenesis protein PilO [Candidatus Zambryskibacteria bacterium]
MKNLIPFILIIFAAGMLYFYSFPEWKKTQSLKSKQTELNLALGQAQELKKIREELTVRYNAISPTESEKINKVIPARYDPIKLVADLNSLGLKYGMPVRDVSISADSFKETGGAIEAPAPATPYKVVKLKFSVEGQYKNFYAFLSDIEKSLQLLGIQKVSVTTEKKSNSKEASTGSLGYEITLDTYWMN